MAAGERDVNLNLGSWAICAKPEAMNSRDARMLDELVDRVRRVTSYITPLIFLVIMGFWLSMAAWTEAEVLDVLVLEVDARLVEPTLARALAKDRAGLDEALEKLRKLAPDKGVVEHASVSVDLGDGKERVGKSGMDFGPDIPDRGAHYRKFGWTLTWEPGVQSREITITPRANPSAAPVFAAKLIHPPDGRWSLSAGTTTPKGALFIFEKIDGRNSAPGGQIWVASSLFAGQNSTSCIDPKPERIFSTNTAIRSSLLREPQEGDPFSSIKTDLKPFCGAWKGYSESRITFSAGMGKLKDAGKIVSMVDFRYLEDIQASTHSQYSATFHQAIGADKLPHQSTEPFEALTTLVSRSGTTTTSRPLPAQKAEKHQHQVLVFHTE